MLCTGWFVPVLGYLGGVSEAVLAVSHSWISPVGEGFKSALPMTMLIGACAQSSVRDF